MESADQVLPPSVADASPIGWSEGGWPLLKSGLAHKIYRRRTTPAAASSFLAIALDETPRDDQYQYIAGHFCLYRANKGWLIPDVPFINSQVALRLPNTIVGPWNRVQREHHMMSPDLKEERFIFRKEEEGQNPQSATRTFEIGAESVKVTDTGLGETNLMVVQNIGTISFLGGDWTSHVGDGWVVFTGTGANRVFKTWF